jgi:hypothetical protein
MSVEGLILHHGEAHGVTLHQTRVDYLVTAEHSKHCSSPFSGLVAAHYHAVASERRCASQQKLCADVADGSGASNWCRSQHTDIVEPPMSAIR